MVFRQSVIESVKIPSTLREIACHTFYACNNLKNAVFSEGIEKIGISAFNYSGIENVVLPSSMKMISGHAFAHCKHLRSIRLNEGLQ